MLSRQNSCRKSQKGVKHSRKKSQKGVNNIIMKRKIYQQLLDWKEKRNHKGQAL